MSGLVRRVRGAVRRLLHPPVAVWHHPSYRLPLASAESDLGIDPRRADYVLTWLLDQGLARPADVHLAELAGWREIERVHDAAYLAELDRPEVVGPILGVDPRRLSVNGMVETWRRSAGGSVAATRHVLREGGASANLLGGFHHAFPDRGAGFCAINDIAVAVAAARAEGLDGRIVVVDVDAHPPDGTAACLDHDGAVMVFSLGVASEWTVPARVRDLRVPAGSGDEVYLTALDCLLSELPEADLAIVLAGADPLAGDRFGALATTEAGLRERDRRIAARLQDVPTVLLPAGGYTPGAWRVFAGTIAEFSGFSAPVHPDYDPLLRRSRDIARTLDPMALGARDPLAFTEEDVAELTGGFVEPRFLGYYTRSGIEYALERYGVLDTLRRMGFDDLAVELHADASPHLARVTARVGGARSALIELSGHKRAIDGTRVFFVDWLMMRDPRAPFTDHRPRLPGQDAPGLGMIWDFAQLLARIAERLGLAGVAMAPSHYHIAWMSRRGFRFVDPKVQGRFEAMQEVLAGLPLLEATTRVESGLPAVDGGVVEWQPEMMVYSRDERLNARLDALAPEVAAEKARILARLRGVSAPPPPP